MDVRYSEDLLRETWYPTYRRHFLRGALARCYDCRRGFWMYQQVYIALLVVYG